MSQKNSIQNKMLDYHSNNKPGKLEINPTTPLNSS